MEVPLIQIRPHHAERFQLRAPAGAPLPSFRSLLVVHLWIFQHHSQGSSHGLHDDWVHHMRAQEMAQDIMEADRIATPQAMAIGSWCRVTSVDSSPLIQSDQGQSIIYRWPSHQNLHFTWDMSSAMFDYQRVCPTCDGLNIVWRHLSNDSGPTFSCYYSHIDSYRTPHIWWLKPWSPDFPIAIDSIDL